MFNQRCLPRVQGEGRHLTTLPVHYSSVDDLQHDDSLSTV